MNKAVKYFVSACVFTAFMLMIGLSVFSLLAAIYFAVEVSLWYLAIILTEPIYIAIAYMLYDLGYGAK